MAHPRLLNRGILYGLASLLLGACAARGPIPQGDFDDMQQKLQALHSWRVEGKIGLRRNGRGNSALVNWQQSRDRYVLRLSGPLGIGTVLIEGDDDTVAVRTKNGRYEASSPEQLLLELTGWQIPISELRYWARGLPAPDLPVERQHHEQGRLASLVQGGWKIEFPDYSLVEGLWLPAKMSMSRPETRLTLIYKRWRLDTAP